MITDSIADVCKMEAHCNGYGNAILHGLDVGLTQLSARADLLFNKRAVLCVYCHKLPRNDKRVWYS